MGVLCLHVCVGTVPTYMCVGAVPTCVCVCAVPTCVWGCCAYMCVWVLCLYVCVSAVPTCVYGCCAYMCVGGWVPACIGSTTCRHRDQKKALNPLELELQVVGSCHVGLGIEHRSFERLTSAPNY